MSDISLSVSRTIKATPETVYNAWLNPELLKQFMIPGDSMLVPSASTDPVEGGRFEIVMRNGDTDLPHKGTYKTLSPHSKIIFTWETPFAEGDSDVEILIAANGTGTDITLNHTRFLTEESRDNHEAGWGLILNALTTVLS